MQARYFDEKRCQKLLDDINFYERIDRIVKLSFSAVLLSVLIFVGSTSLAVWLFIALLALKGAKWLAVQGVRYALRKWYRGLLYHRISDLSGENKIGRYTLDRLREWIKEICHELEVDKPTELIIYDSKYPNAFAGQKRWLGLFMGNRIGFMTNMFHLLDPQEFRSIIAHEIGHHKRFPSVGVISGIVIPLLTDRPAYRSCLEHLSDWYAAKTVGVIPTANALIKLHHRGHLMIEINKALSYVQEDFKIGLAGIAEFQEIANEVIPNRLKPNESLDKYMTKIIDRYFEKRSPALKGVGKSHVSKYRKDLEVRFRNRFLKSGYRFIDWRLFDNRIKDNKLDEQEFEELYLRLKGDPNARLFSSYVVKPQELEKWLSHPPLRERLIFIMEAVAVN